MHRVLGVFAKEPRAGQVKSRLAVVIGAEPAARLYEAFLRDFLPRLEPLTVNRVLAYTPESGKAFFESWLRDRFELEPQSGVDLGARMSAFFERRFAQRPTQVVLVGSDTPDVPLARIEQAFQELQRHELVLGPCDDGGYYLVGMSRLIVEIFRAIDWGSSDVLAQTVSRTARLSVRPVILEPWYDVDRPDDLRRLWSAVTAVRRTGKDPGLLHTEAMIGSLLASL